MKLLTIASAILAMGTPIVASAATVHNVVLVAWRIHRQIELGQGGGPTARKRL
jgi:hypothetical protein